MWSRVLGNPLRSLGNPGGGGINYLLRILFSTDDAAPLTNPYVGEIDSLVPVEVDGTLAVASGVLTNTAQATPVEGDLGYYSTAKHARVGGRIFYCKITLNTLNTYPIIFLSPNLSANSTGAELTARMENPLAVNDGGYFSLGRTLTATTYEVALVEKTTGGELIIKGGVFADWNRVWVFNTGTSAQLAAAVGLYNGLASTDSMIVFDSPTFSGDVETTRVSAFTQSLGSELFTNNNFDTFTVADTPNGWVEYNESAGVRDLTQVAPGNLHGAGGTGALNIFSSSGATGVSQNIATLGDLYEMLVEVTARGSGTINIYFGGSDTALTTLAVVSAFRIIGRSNTGGSVWPGYVGGAADITIDNTSFKEITRNTPSVISNHSRVELTFVLPVSPKSGDEIYQFYRMTAADEEFYNGWGACLSRNAANTQWDFTVYSWATGTRTTRLTTVTNVGNVTRIRVSFDGNNHDWWTQVGTVWTKRGTTVSNAAFNTGTYINTVYSSGFTPASMYAWKNDLSAYATQLTPT